MAPASHKRSVAAIKDGESDGADVVKFCRAEGAKDYAFFRTPCYFEFSAIQLGLDHLHYVSVRRPVR